MIKPPPKRINQMSRFFFASLILVFSSHGWGYLVENSNFTTDLNSWNQAEGTWVYHPDDGIGDLGSAETTSTGAGSASINQCAHLTDRVAGGRGLYAIFFGNPVNHTNPLLISLELFTTDDCSGGATSTQQFQIVPTAQDNWRFIYTVGTAPATGMRSARLWATAFSSAAGQITRIDLLALTDNLHFNPDFNIDLGGWGPIGGIWEHIDTDGYGTPPGTAQVTIDDIDCGAGNACAFITQCLNLSDAPASNTLFPGAGFKALDALNELVITGFFYPETACGGEMIGGQTVPVPIAEVGVWRRHSGGFSVPQGAQSVQVFIGANDGTPGDRFMIDSIFLGLPAGIPLIKSGFEAGQ